MSRDWKTVTLSAVATIQSGSGFPEKFQGQTDQEIPFFKVSDMNLVGNEREMNYSNNTVSEQVRAQLGASIFTKGSTIFPKIGGAIATNKKRLTTKRCCVDNNVMGAIPDGAKIDSNFLFYFFLAHDLSEFANEAHLPSIKKTVVESWPISLPINLAEQQRIVGILDEAFDGIATAKANAEKNLQNARALFESHVQSVFTRRGDGWADKRLDDVCVIGDGNHSSNYPKKEELVSEGIPFIRATNLVAGEICEIDMRFLSPEKHAQLKKGHLKTGDILFTNRGEIGKTAIVDADHDGSNLNSQIAWLRCDKTLNNRFLFHLLSSGAIKSHLESAKSGAALQQFTIRQIKELAIPCPPKHEQDALVVGLDGLSEETQRLESLYQRKLTALDELKKSLLHQAFSGAL